MHLTTIDEIKNYSNIFADNYENHDNQEIIKILDEKLSGDIRIIYLKLKSGNKVNRADQTKLLNKIKEILCLKNEDSLD